MAGTPDPAEPPPETLVRRARPAMGTLLHVSASGHDRAGVEAAVEAALAAVAQVDELMSFHAPDSELSRINREAAHAPQPVHAWTAAVLRRALRISAASAGLFDVTVAPLLVEAGLLPPPKAPPARGGWRDVRLDAGGRVRFSAPVWIDLGGIAKGFAVDVAIHCLRRGGCTQGSVNAGGDLRRFGPQPETVHLRTAQGLMPMAELRCGAVATSAVPVRQPERLAQPIGCIMDPHRRRAWEGEGAVMVAAPTCTLADALTKVAALGGPAAQPVLERFGASARWIPSD